MTTPIFEDNHLLILNKPAGLLTQPSGTGQDSLEQQAKAYIKELKQKSGNVFLEAVHRLDKPVSGIVVFAKSSKALSRLNQAMRNKQVRKIYWAIVEGVVSSDEGSLEHYLVHDDFHAKVVEACHPEGKKAILHFKVLQRTKNKTMIEIELATGRYHQIRLQLSASGHPILGDHKYSSKLAYEGMGIALHHRQLQLTHPVTQQLMMFEALPPSSFLTLE